MITKIAITPGEPAGIGPEILVKVAQKNQSSALIAFADTDLLLDRAKRLQLPLNLLEWSPAASIAPLPASTLLISPIKMANTSKPGVPDKNNISYLLQTLTAATDACLNGHCDSLVTGPVNKGLFLEAGISFSGHTEFLANYTHSPDPVMMLATKGLRVALVTTHLPLRNVPDAITSQRIETIISIVHKELIHLLNKPSPKIFVLGLNPHAGDNGAIGGEENDVIIPALNTLRHQGMDIIGPCSADTAFSQHNRNIADVFIAMYHDQGLPVLKTIGFGQIVNVTLGLKIIRTSVDHGTAFDLAGTGLAKEDSMQLAIDIASEYHVKNISRRAG